MYASLCWYQFNSSSYKIVFNSCKVDFQVQNCTQVYAGPSSNQSDNFDGFSNDNFDGFSILVPSFQLEAKFPTEKVYAGPIKPMLDGFSILVPVFLKIRPCATNLIQVVTK